MIAGAIDRNITRLRSSTTVKNNVFPLKLSGGWMFSKVNITDNANSLLKLVETNFYEVGLAPPCLFLFLQTLISSAIS